MAATTAKAMIFSMSPLDHSLDHRSNRVPVSKYFNSAFAYGIERRQERHAPPRRSEANRNPFLIAWAHLRL